MNSEKSSFHLHMGGAIKQIADKYPKLDLVILEYIQNALDEKADKIWVKVDFKKRDAYIRDNGKGVSRQEFEVALSQICRSQKKEDSLGQYGIGLVSAIGKCNFLIFTSTPKANSRAFTRWTFDSRELVGTQTISGIPCEEVPELIFTNVSLKSGKTISVNYRTEVHLKGITKDRSLTKLSKESLVEAILDRFSEAMRKRNCQVFLTIIEENGDRSTEEIQAAEFLGRRLGKLEIRGVDAGTTTIDLYISPKKAKGRQGRVSIGISDNDYRIPFKTFAKEHSEWFSDDVQSLLNSGIFEGYILSERCELDPGRKKFIENDAFTEFLVHIEHWHKKFGIDYAADVTETGKEEKLQLLGLKSMTIIEGILNDPKFKNLMDVVKSSKYGTTGSNHFNANDSNKQQIEPSLSTASVKREEQLGGNEEKNKKKEDTSGNNEPPKKDHKLHTPFTVIGTFGKRRNIVKGHSMGLQFLYAEMPGKAVLWEFDPKTAILSFNVRHPLWEEAEKNDVLLMRFQESIAIKALTIETMPNEWKEAAIEFAREEASATLSHLELILPKKGRTKK